MSSNVLPALALALSACDGEGSRHPPLPALHTGAPSTPDEPGCHPHPDNPLRAVCLFERDGTGPVEVAVRPQQGDDAEVVFAGDPEATDVRIVVWDLLALNGYEYDVIDRGQPVLHGTFVTGTVPQSVRPVLDTVVDGPSALGPDDRILFALACSGGPMLMLVDAAGRLRWYEPTAPFGGITGFDLTDRGTVVAAMGRRRILELGFDGVPRTDVSFGSGLPHSVHHAVIGTADRILALDMEPVPYPDGETYLVDGVTAVPYGGAVGERVWDVTRIVDPVGLPGGDPLYWELQFAGGVDFAHENSISLTADGGWLLSFKQLDTIVSLGPDALTPRWAVTGGPTEAEIDAPRLVLGSSAGLDPAFRHPHHASETPWGTLLLVDNGVNQESTRVVEIAVDPGAGTADLIAEWDLGASCPVQSSVYALPDGTLFAACARTRELFELHRDAPGEIRRRTALSCADGVGGRSFVRARPLTLPSGR